MVLFILLVTHGGSYFFPLVRVARPPHGGIAGAFRDYFHVQGKSLSNFFDVQGRALLAGRWNVHLLRTGTGAPSLASAGNHPRA